MTKLDERAALDEADTRVAHFIEQADQWRSVAKACERQLMDAQAALTTALGEVRSLLARAGRDA